MKRIGYFLLAILIFAAIGCSNNNPYDVMPSEIKTFVAQYYPNTDIETFTSTPNSYTVILKNGPTLRFNNDYKWVSINGNGMVLPQVLLFNDFPPELYEYLQETNNTNSVFFVSRNSISYTVKLLSSTLSYDISDGKISGNETSPAN